LSKIPDLFVPAPLGSTVIWPFTLIQTLIQQCTSSHSDLFPPHANAPVTTSSRQCNEANPPPLQSPYHTPPSTHWCFRFLSLLLFAASLLLNLNFSFFSCAVRPPSFRGVAYDGERD
jgi:hypothetical protein